MGGVSRPRTDPNGGYSHPIEFSVQEANHERVFARCGTLYPCGCRNHHLLCPLHTHVSGILDGELPSPLGSGHHLRLHMVARVRVVNLVRSPIREIGHLPEVGGKRDTTSIKPVAIGLRENGCCVFFLPIVLVAVVLLAFDEAATSVLHRQVMGKLWSRLWVVAAGMAGVTAQLLIVAGLLLPMFRMGSVVK